MELDSRILEGKKPLDCFDTDIAKQFIGHEGYFCDHRSGFTNIYNLVKDVLRDITPDDNYCEVYKTNCTSWEYFLPEEWIKEPEEKPEKKYRPFSLNEFTELYAIGDVVTYRIKDCEVIEQSMFIGCQSSNDEKALGNGYVVIGNCKYSLKELFNNYELQYLNHWQPFGTLEE